MEPDNYEISFYKFWSMLWYRLPLIILLTICSFAISLGFSFLRPNKYIVTATVKSNYIDNIKHYTDNELNYFLYSQDNLSKYVDEKHSLSYIKKNLSINYNNQIDLIIFNTSPVNDPDFWCEIINESIKNINDIIDKKYIEAANSSISEIKANIQKIDIATQQTENRDLYAKLLLQESQLLTEIDNFNHCLNFISSPQITKENLKNPIVIGIIGALIGFVLGVICALVIGFNDKHIRLSEDIENNVRNGKLVLTVPEYKNFSELNKKYFEYLLSLLSEDDRTILITSLSENSGISTFAAGMKSILNDQKTIIKGESFIQTPSILKDINNNDATIILLRRDQDSLKQLIMFDQALNKIDSKKIFYVFNFSCKRDNKVLKFDSDKNFKNLKYRFF